MSIQTGQRTTTMRATRMGSRRSDASSKHTKYLTSMFGNTGKRNRAFVFNYMGVNNR